MKILETILNLINGKKATIFAALGLVITYLLTNGYIDTSLAELLSGLLVLAAGGSNVANAIIAKKSL